MTRLILPEDIDLPRFLAELEAWCRIESPTSARMAVNHMADRVLQHSARLSLQFDRIETMAADLLIIWTGPKDEAAKRLLLCHLDTVHPLGTLGSSLPWRRVDDRLYGPGVYDMKSGALMALEAMALAGVPAMALFSPDEETGSLASRAFIEKAAGHAQVALVMEPAREGGKIVSGRRGTAAYRFEIKGVPAHSGTRPQDGRSAIREAAHLVLRLEALNAPERNIGVNVGLISGGTARNTIPGHCSVEVDVRLPNLEAQREIVAAIEALSPLDPDVTWQRSGGVTRPAFAETQAQHALMAKAAPVAAQMGYELKSMISGGGSDGNFTAGLGVPTLDGLGPDGAGAHTLDEHIYISSIAPRLAMLANLLRLL